MWEARGAGGGTQTQAAPGDGGEPDLGSLEAEPDGGLALHAALECIELWATEDAGVGDGPVDAALKAIDRLTEMSGRLKDYAIRAVSQGKDALGEVSMKVDFGDGELVTGRGASTDIIEASARAYLNAVNRHLNTNGDGRKRRRQP